MRGVRYLFAVSRLEPLFLSGEFGTFSFFVVDLFELTSAISDFMGGSLGTEALRRDRSSLVNHLSIFFLAGRLEPSGSLPLLVVEVGRIIETKEAAGPLADIGAPNSACAWGGLAFFS